MIWFLVRSGGHSVRAPLPYMCMTRAPPPILIPAPVLATTARRRRTRRTRARSGRTARATPAQCAATTISRTSSGLRATRATPGTVADAQRWGPCAVLLASGVALIGVLRVLAWWHPLMGRSRGGPLLRGCLPGEPAPSALCPTDDIGQGREDGVSGGGASGAWPFAGLERPWGGCKQQPGALHAPPQCQRLRTWGVLMACVVCAAQLPSITLGADAPDRQHAFRPRLHPPGSKWFCSGCGK